MSWPILLAVNTFMLGCNLTVAWPFDNLTTYNMVNIPINILGTVISYLGLRRDY